MTRKRKGAGKQGSKGLAGDPRTEAADMAEIARRKAEIDAAHMEAMRARPMPGNNYVPPASRFASLARVSGGWRCKGNGYSVSEGG